MSKEKGDRRERQARDHYESAGYKVERSQGTRWDRTDWYGHFDLMAMRPDGLVFIQVKSNQASGIQDMLNWARFWGAPGIKYDIAVCHDREGWRLIRLFPDADTYEVVVDERDQDCSMGDELTRYLEQ